MGKQKGKKNISVVDFCRAYNGSNGDAADTARVLGVTVGNVYTRANKLRNQGVKLVEPRGHKPLDVDALNAMLAGEQAE